MPGRTGLDDDTAGAPGWTARGIVALGAAVLAGGFVSAFLAVEGRGVEMTGDLRAFAVGTLLGHVGGGALVGFALAGLFGRRGVAGWGLAVLGGALVTLLGGLLGTAVETVPALLRAGSVVAEMIRVAAGMAVTPLAIVSAPWLGAVWAAGVAAIHLAAGAARARAA